MDETNLLYQAETFAIRGAIFDVWKEMGAGFLESVYQECLATEFAARSIPAISQKELRLTYKGKPLGQTFKPDFICYEKVIVELKHVRSFTDDHRAQIINYLRATNIKVGLLVNFGSYEKAQVERFVF